MSVLLITSDSQMHHDVARLAAAAGAELRAEADVGVAMHAWNSASLVLVGADLSATLAAKSPPRRAGVHVVGRSPMADMVFRTAVALGAETVSELPGSDQWLVETLTDAVDGGGRRGELIGVLGGSGGAGASVLAAALALKLAESGATALVDADPWGPGLDRLLGLESAAGAHWEDLNVTTGRLSARALRESLPGRDELSVLTWAEQSRSGLQPYAVREVLGAALRGFDKVVVDLPRHADPVSDDTLARCDRLVLVVGSTLASASAAARVAVRVRAASAVPYVVVRGVGAVRPADLGRLLHLPITCVMPDQRGLDEALDLGAGPLRYSRGNLARACRELAERFSQTPAKVA